MRFKLIHRDVNPGKNNLALIVDKEGNVKCAIYNYNTGEWLILGDRSKPILDDFVYIRIDDQPERSKREDISGGHYVCLRGGCDDCPGNDAVL